MSRRSYAASSEFVLPEANLDTAELPMADVREIGFPVAFAYVPLAGFLTEQREDADLANPGRH